MCSGSMVWMSKEKQADLSIPFALKTELLMVCDGAYARLLDS